jgi:hypothetical protein
MEPGGSSVPFAYHYMDFLTTEWRRVCCEFEVRLNHRTAPDVMPGVDSGEEVLGVARGITSGMGVIMRCSGRAMALLLAMTVGPAHAQSQPAAVTVGAADGITVSALRLTVPLVLDGVLDEPLYALAPMPDFVQYEPVYGVEATQRTQVWVAFDDDSVYVAARLWESELDRMVANEMRRDSNNTWQNETFAIVLDTFHDRRNGLEFAVNPLGGRNDGQVTNEGSYNGDWNPVWDLATGRFTGGWTVEMSLPFKSLRYAPGADQTWGFQARRYNRWKNELSFLASPPAGLGQNGIFRVSAAATLRGLEVPPPSRNLEVKPFMISDLSSNLTTTPAVRNEVAGDLGLDVKYGITPNLTADLTLNTDFAQVEADERQVNLTRFSLFFPEKREFFLENAGLFQFGGANGGNGDVPVLFYSRRIGLEQGQDVPIVGGGRVTGRIGAFGVGAFNIQTDAVGERGLEATNFSVLRLRRDILRRSSVGLIYTNRSVSAVGSGANHAYGIDARLGFFDTVTVNAYWARTNTPGLGGDDQSHRVFFQYSSDLYGVSLHHLMVGRDYNPEVGFLFRNDMNREYAAFRFSPRPASIAAVRQFSWQVTLQYLEDRGGQLDTREQELEFETTFENSDVLTAVYADRFEFLDRPFAIANGITLPVAGYSFGNLNLSYAFGDQRPVSGSVTLEQGRFWSGNKTTLGVSGGRVTLSPQLAVEPSVSYNRVTLPEGDFTTTVASTRVTYTVTPLMFVSGLVQYGSRDESVGTNLRFRWEYQPGSELFVVYDESRDTGRSRYLDLQNRALVVKINRLIRF